MTTKKQLMIPQDWEPEQGYVVAWFCFPNSPYWRAIISGMFYDLRRGRKWDADTGTITDVQVVARAIEESLCMANCDDVVVNLDRIAVALESIDSKTEKYTYGDLIDDIEDAFGIASLPYEIVSGIVGLMPRLQAKVDMTWLAQAIYEYITFRAPVKALALGMNVSLGIIAAAAAAQKILGIADLVVKVLGLMQTTALGWKDIIFGDKNIWDDVLYPLFKAFIGPSLGGDAPTDDPDSDPELRAEVNLLNEIFVQGDIIKVLNNINAGGCCASVGTSIEQDDGVEGEDPPAGTSPPSAIDARKCKAANMLYDDLLAIITTINGQDLDLLPSFDLGGAVGLITNILDVLDNWITHALQQVAGLVIDVTAWIIQQLLGASFDLSNILAEIENNQEDLVCALYNATSAGAARDAFLDVMSLSSLEQDFVDFFLPNDALNVLFFSSADSEARLADYVSTVDCSVCSFTGTVSFGSPDDDITDYGTYGITAEFAAGWGCVTPREIAITFTTPVNITLSLTSGSLGSCNLNNIYKFASGPDYSPLIYNSNTPPSYPITCQSFFILSDANFTMDVTIEEA